jgi:hypothetical protein
MPHPLPGNKDGALDTPAENGMFKDSIVLGLTSHESTDKASVIFAAVSVGLITDASCAYHSLITAQALLQLHPPLIQHVDPPHMLTHHNSLARAALGLVRQLRVAFPHCPP